MKIITFKLLVTLVLASIMMACGSDSKKDITPTYQLLLKEIKTKVNNQDITYKFSYDKDKRMTVFRSSKNNQRAEVTYNSNNKLTKIIMTEDGLISFLDQITTTITVTYINDDIVLVKKVVVNADGRETSKNTEKYTIYPNGRLKTKVVSSVDNTNDEYIYNGKDNLSKIKYADGTLDEFIKYDDNINPLYENETLRQFLYFMELINFYHISKNNNTEKEYSKPDLEKRKIKATYEYNQEGYPTKKSENDASETTTTVMEFKY